MYKLASPINITNMINNAEKQKPRVALYLRVSTDEQTKGYGLIGQKEKLRAFVLSQDYSLNEDHIYTEEGYSGTLPIDSRPELKRLFTDAQNSKFDVVLVYRLDRFFRNVRLMLESIELLGSYNVGFRSITEAFDTTNSTGKFMTTLLGAVAEMERDTIRERTMNGKTSAAKAGKWPTGVPPYGYRVNKTTKKLIVVEEEAKIVRKLYELLVHERLPLREIERYINNSGSASPKHTTIKTRNSLNYWHRRTIGRMLTNETYTGQAFFRKYIRPFNNLTSLLEDNLKRPKEDWIEIPVPPIISRDLFNKAKEQLTENRDNAKRNMKHSYLYAKILYCGYCNFKLFSGFQPPNKKGGSNNGTKYYHGTARKKDEVGTTRRCTPICSQCAESRLEPIWNCLKSILEDPKNAIPALEQYTFKDKNKEDIQKKILQTEKQIGAIVIKRKKLGDVYVATELNEKDYKYRLDELKKEEGRTKEELAKLNQFIVSKKEKAERPQILNEMFTEIKVRLENATYSDKQYIIGLFIEKITLRTRSNYADVIFRFPSKNNEKGLKAQLYLTIKILSETERRREILMANPSMYVPKALV